MAKRNNSTQMKEAMDWDRGAGQPLVSEVPVGQLVDTSDNTNQAKTRPCEGSHGETEREKRREKKNMESREEMTSSCCSLSELKSLPQCHGTLQSLSFSRTHTVLIDVNALFSEGRVRAQPGQHLWHSNVVKMPHSPESHITKPALFGSNQTERWQVISKQLQSLAKKTTASVDDVKNAIQKYNPKYESQWSFDALESFVESIPKSENYYPSLFPKIANLASRLPDVVKKAIPLLRSGQAASITLSQVQIACLLANAFYCTFPHRNSSNPRAEYNKYPTINFNSLFGKWSSRKKEKLRAIFHYFKVVTDDTTREPDGLVTFERRCLSSKDMPAWRSCTKVMPKLYVSSEGRIEKEGTGMLQVDFACSLVGGGVLGSGLVQEEILFLMNPELIVSRLFTEKLDDNECLIITGSQQFSMYSGYSDSFEWAGPYEDDTKRDEWRRRHRQILAIDAKNYRHPREQYSMISITRELNKVYCGFKPNGSSDNPDIATGNWGCGAFHGDPKLKALIQLMAAAEAGRGLAFFTFKNAILATELQRMHHLLATQGTTVGQLYALLEDYCAVMRSAHVSPDVFDFVSSTMETPSQPQSAVRKTRAAHSQL